MLKFCYEPDAGLDITEAAKMAIYHASEEDSEIVMIFNGKVIRVEGYMTVKEVVKKYMDV